MEGLERKEKLGEFGIPRSWPQLKGLSGEDAKKDILNSHPHLKVDIIPRDAMVTMDFRENRVRIFVDEEGVVVRPPRIG